MVTPRVTFSISFNVEQYDIVSKNAKREDRSVCQYIRERALGTDFEEREDPTRFDRWLKPDGDNSIEKNKSAHKVSFDEWVKPDGDNSIEKNKSAHKVSFDEWVKPNAD